MYISLTQTVKGKIINGYFNIKYVKLTAQRRILHLFYLDEMTEMPHISFPTVYFQLFKKHVPRIPFFDFVMLQTYEYSRRT